MSSGTGSGANPEDRPELARLHIWQFQFVRDVLLIAAVAALIWLGYLMRAVTVPLLVALLLAYLFEPLVSRLAAHPKLSRPVVVGGLLCSVGVVVVLILVIITSAVVSQTTRLIDDVREGRFQERIVLLREYIPEEQRAIADEWFDWLLGTPDEPENGAASDAHESVPADEVNEADQPRTEDAAAANETAADEWVLEEQWLRAIIREEIDQSAAWYEEPVTSDSAIDWLGIARGGAGAAGAVWSVLLAVIQIGFIAFLIPFYFFFFSVWFPGIAAFGQGLIPSSKRKRAHELLTKMDNVIAGFVRGRIIVSLIMGAMFAVGWWFVGVPYAIVLGFITGIFCIVPFLGVIGVPIAIGLLFFDQLDPDKGLQMAWWAIILWPTVVFSVVQFIESYALTPIIAGKATNLDPVTMVVAVIAGGAIMGIYGMLLAIPVAACLKILIMEVLLPKVRDWTEGRAADPLPIEE